MFYRDLQEASRFEAALLSLLQSKGLNAWLNPAEDLDGKRAYDIGVHNGHAERKLELKLDLFSIHSPNFVLEEPTLQHSQADFFVIGLVQPFILTRYEAGLLYSQSRKVMGGDGGRTRMALVPKSVLKDQYDPVTGQLREPRTGKLIWTALNTNELFQ